MSGSGDGGKRLLGLASGLAFGALLQRGRLNRYDVIVDQLRLKDGRVVKAMASAFVVGAVGYHLLARRGIAKKSVKPLEVAGVCGGAALFGTGLALFGYCPGTSLAAVGEGRRDAMAGVLGMFVGAGLFVTVYPKIAPLLKAGGNLGKLTMPTATKTQAGPWVAGLASTAVAGMALAEARAI